MSHLQGLPPKVIDLIEQSIVAEFATVSAAGLPIDTPTYVFPSDDLDSLGIATGLSYPAKAERARRNPKVGMLLEGGPDDPVVCIRGHAAVRDANLQANAVRYISETGFKGIDFGLSWEAARKAVWYWTRIIVEVSPVRILWWDNPAAMDAPPHVWDLAQGAALPQSDPAPGGKVSPPSKWQGRSIAEMAEDALGRGNMPHLTLLDSDGYPLPIRVRQCEFAGDSFRLVLPRGTPWSGAGNATLSFEGFQNFVGEAIPDGDATIFKVERTLPENPLTRDPKEVLQPSEATRASLMERLEAETKRRGQSIPEIPSEEPAPTRLAKVRQARIAALMGAVHD